MRRLLVAGLVFGLPACSYFFPSCQTIPPCPTGQTQCTQASCADLTTDPLNCGACNNVCALGLSCLPAGDGGGVCGCLPGSELQAGGCVAATPCGATRCPTDGGSACANLVTDDANCGACGAVCPTGAFCQSSHCVCLDGTSPCGGSCCGGGGACVDGGCTGSDGGAATDGGPGDGGAATDAGPDGGGDAGP